MTPALAVIQKLPKDAEVVYVGRKHPLEGDTAVSLEYETMQSLDIPFISVHPGRLQRKMTRYTLSAFGRVPKGLWEAFFILKKEKPDVVLSFGGYVAFPFAVAASLQKIPVVTHEQTLEAGATNKLIAKFATKVCTSFPTSAAFFPKEKVVLTGDPLPLSKPSKDIQLLTQKNKYPLITISGGSLGSHAINILVEPMIEKLLAKYRVFHITGDAKEYGDFDKLQKIKESLPYTFQERYILKKFVSPHDIRTLYTASDVVISRSGINSVLTLLLANTPSLLIPLTFSQRQEQQKNALLLESVGLGHVLDQKVLTSDELLKHIEEVLSHRSVYKNSQIHEMQQLHEHAAEHITTVVYDTQKRYLQKKI